MRQVRRKRLKRLPVRFRTNIYDREGGLLTPVNTCMLIGNDGTNYGFETGSYGSVTPTTTLDGTLFYSFTVDAAGNVAFRFGPTGTDKLEDTDEMLLRTAQAGDVILVWNATNSAYEVVDIDIATNIIAEDGNVVCGAIYALPNLFLHYTFETIDTIE